MNGTKVIAAYLQGGLGNQCFIYAAARALSLRANANLQLNVDMLLHDGYGRTFALDPFAGVPPPLPVRVMVVRKFAYLRALLMSRLGEGTKTYPCESSPARFRPFQTDWRGRLTLRNGFWQSERYFEDCRGQILRDFQLKDDAWLKSDPLAQRIEATEHSVFLHVRTFREVPGNEGGRGALEMRGYYRHALLLLAAQLPAATVFVFSDDLDWARRNVLTDEVLAGIPFKFVYDTGGGDFRDFMLMRLCRHGVVADSTFSWWAGWLGEQARLARGESAMRLHVDHCRWNNDFWPARWVAVEG